MRPSAPRFLVGALCAHALVVRAQVEQQQPPLPEGNAYVRSLLEGQRAQDEAINDYAYDLEERREELDGEGRTKETHTRRSQVYFVKGRSVRRLVSVDGVPLSPKKQAEEDRAAEERARAIREGRTVQETPSVRLWTLSEKSDFKAVARELREGRSTLVFDFAPQRAAEGWSGKAGEPLLQALSGRLWIDEEKKRVARIDAKSATGASTKIRTGVSVNAFSLMAEFQALQGEGGPGGVWLPKKTEVVVAGRAFLFKKFRARLTTTYSNYRRFAVETEEKR